MSRQVVVKPGLPAGRMFRTYGMEAKYEFLKQWRSPFYVIPTIGFPLMFYVMFGLVLGGKQSLGALNVGTYLLATYGVVGVMGASMFGFAVGVSTERGYGWLQMKQSSPMPPMAYLVAKTVMAMLFSAIVAAGLFSLGMGFGVVRLPLSTMLALAGVLVFGSITFCALGLALGTLCAPASAPAMANVIFMPLSFCSGLWLPLPLLPKALQHVAPFLPPYHLAQLALKTAGAANTGSAAQHVIALAAFCAVFLLLALFGFRRDDVKMDG